MGLTPQHLAGVVMRVGGDDASFHRSHLDAKVQEIYDRLATTEPIKADRAKLEAAKAAEAKVRRAQSELNKRLAALHNELREAEGSVTDQVIARYSDGGMSQQDTLKLERPLQAVLTEERILLRAVDRVALERSFTSQAAVQTAEAELYETFAAALDAESETRLRQTQKLAAEVVEFEGEVSLPGGSHTVSGALQQAARDLRAHAAGCRKAAQESLAKQQSFASQPPRFRRQMEG